MRHIPLLAVCAFALWGHWAKALSQDDEENPFLPALIAKYSDPAGDSFRRLDEAIGFHWNDAPPDPRIAADNFDVRWHGRIFAQGAGEYHLAVHANGEVEVKVAGKTVISRQEAAGWLFSQPIALEFDRHELEVSFRKTKSPASISLYWSGPQFGLEPVPPRFLVHDRKEMVSTAYERGELLATALRCAACHREESAPQPMPAPSLLHLSGNVSAEWLHNWLSDQGHQQASAQRRMPAYGLSGDEAKAITAYLLSPTPEKMAPAKAPAPEKPTGKKPKDPPSPATGERLFLTLGCLACHQVGELGESGLFGGGDLSKIASKRPTEFFSTWLTEPAKLNPDHRMPVFDLGQDERASLSLYLASLGPSKKPASDEKPEAGLVATGRKLVSTHRCTSCHSLPKAPELAAASTAKPLGEQSDWSKSCAAAFGSRQAHLGYSLTKDDQKALQEFYSAKLMSKAGQSKLSGRLALIQNNCLACHGREGVESLATSLPKKLADKLAALSQKHFGLAGSVPAMTPPSLNSIGDKFHEDALAAVIRRQGPPLRDYLLVRMPRFPLPEDELKRLTNYFIQTDRIPPLPDAAATKPTPAEEAAFSLAGSRLVSTDGFGCTSCHQVGKVIPDKAPLNARGPSLSSLDKRIRKEWYDRFLRNPARIVPRMEMPSVQIPVRGVLDSKLDPQLAALWHVLATPGFEPPEPNPVRVLRQSGSNLATTPPLIITDIVKDKEQEFVQPFVIGLPNRHNILFDLRTHRLADWWIGDMGRQRTKGKSWYWEVGGLSLIDARKTSELSVILGDAAYEFDLNSEHATWVHSWICRERDPESRRNSVELVYHGTLQRKRGNREIGDLFKQGAYLTQSWRMLKPGVNIAGFTRRIEFRRLGGPCTLVFAPFDSDAVKDYKIENDGKELRLATRANSRIRVATPSIAIFSGKGEVQVAAEDKSKNGLWSVAMEFDYVTDLASDVPPPPVERPISEEATLQLGSGLIARRLPFRGDILPTGLSWRPDDKLVFCTLRGEVFLADVEGKVTPELSLVSDGLSAPYGVFAEYPLHGKRGTVDVATKGAVLELSSYDKEPSFLTVRRATGWGHTTDYHDWTVGFAQSRAGEYYVGLPCQQDRRSEAEARWRGTVAKITRRKEGEEGQDIVEPLSTGHRFPMGLAVNKDGDLFVTDNQGNYNPFNELNHVRKGAFFGFVNANDKKNRDYKVPRTTEPAINIPHPWTRSVNGICFLYTPEKLRKETGKDAFGPLEGQLVGCEYDTRRLIRMSLQKIGDTYQGCAYPLSKEPSSPEKGFLGPIVCAVSPRGELYVGSIRESGWGAGNNVGEIVKIKFEPEKLPCGIGEVKAVKGGFSIDFLKEVDSKKAADIANYSISSYRRISTPAYGGPDVDRRTEKVDSVELSADRRRVTVKLPELRAGGFVYEIQLKNLAPENAEFFPGEAYFTLHGVP